MRITAGRAAGDVSGDGATGGTAIRDRARHVGRRCSATYRRLIIAHGRILLTPGGSDILAPLTGHLRRSRGGESRDPTLSSEEAPARHPRATVTVISAHR